MASECYNDALRFHAAVAQLDRVPGYEPGGRGFESCQPRQVNMEMGTSFEVPIFVFTMA